MTLLTRLPLLSRQSLVSRLGTTGWLLATAFLLACPFSQRATAQPPQKSKLDTSDDEEEPPIKPSAGNKNPKPASGSKVGGAGRDAMTDDEENPLSGGNASSKNDGSLPVEQPDPTLAESDQEMFEPVCDELVFKAAADKPETIWQVQLLPTMLTPIVPKQQYVFRQFSKSGSKNGAIIRTRGEWIDKNIDYYEKRVWTRAAEELEIKPRELLTPGTLIDLHDETAHKRAERVMSFLQRGLQEHLSATHRNLRLGPACSQELRQPLLIALFNLRLSEIAGLAGSQSAEAESQFMILRKEFQELNVDHILNPYFEKLLLPRAKGAFNAGEYAMARAQLMQLDGLFHGKLLPASQAFRQKLIDSAKERFASALRLKASQPRQAGVLLDEAAAIWPELPDLADLRHELSSEFPTLEVAYADFPEVFCPLTGHTDAERHGAALLFEGLVRWVDDPQYGPHCVPALSTGRPVPLAKGRQFRLPGCKWSDSDKYVTREDVIWSMKLLTNDGWPGYSPVWQQLVQSEGNSEDPFLVSIKLRRDYWQPLALMHFKILPKHCFANDPLGSLKAFEENPVGTGPYVISERGEDFVRFRANPKYREPGKPQIREITLRQRDPGKSSEDFLQNKIQIIYGLQKDQIARIANKDRESIKSLVTRSVYFLAPNHRRPAMQNRQLRLAIAHALDRRAMLTKFRTGRAAEYKAELTGPFPKNSWAYSRQDFAYEPRTVEAYLANAHITIPPLRLVYQASDDKAENACQEIREALAGKGITVELDAAAPQHFYRQVLVDHAFDLVYWQHHYADETYSLDALLDSNPKAMGPGGSNFIGYKPDAELAEILRDLHLHKKFEKVQELMRKIHDHVFHTAFIIPLWQMDVTVAVSENVVPARLDPLELFGDVQNWRFRPSSD